jgi:chemotaxis response regulator CheB
MAEPTPATESQRVALLARPGKAADNLADALRQAGAELVLIADPNGLDEAGLLASQPQAVLVALEPGVEHAIDRLDSVLSSSQLTVIFDEADLAAHRAGWDAARWVRHLSAKLHRHQRVLPPGGEAETEEWYPSPGQLPKPAGDFAELDFGAFAQEAAVRADAVPADGIQFDSMARATVSDVGTIAVVDHVAPMSATQSDGASDIDTLASDLTPPPLPQPPQAFETSDVQKHAVEEHAVEQHAPVAEAAAGWVLDEAMQSEAAIPRGESNERTLDPPNLQPMQFDDDAFFLETLSAETTPSATIDASSDIGFDFAIEEDLDDTASSAKSGARSVSASDLAFDLPVDFDAVAPQAADTTDFDFESSDTAAGEDAVALSLQEPSAYAVSDTPSNANSDIGSDMEPAGFEVGSFGELSLADDAATMPAEQKSEAGARDLSSLEARISHLSLVDIDTESVAPPAASVEVMTLMEAESAQPVSLPPPLPAEAVHAPVATGIGFRGIVLIEAGLGGPDPVRQVLSALPPTFPLPVLVRLHLQGGRYDRLVTQMERAASLPVVLATVGEHVRSGCIYFLPEGVGLRALANGMEFIAHPSPARTIFAALPAEDSAVLFLSGSDSALIEDALQAAETGALVIAQSPEDCYDGAACAQLRSQGAASGVPSELASRLLSHSTS